MTMSLADAFAMKSKQDRRQSNQEAAKERVLQSDYAQNRIQAAIELVEDVQDDVRDATKTDDDYIECDEIHTATRALRDILVPRPSGRR